MIDLVVEGNVYLDGGLNKCCIGIDEGKIVAIKKILKGDQHFDFGDKLILPAGIDAHVHFREPGYTNKEDFSTGTLAAAFGGIGCVLDMPNTKPPVTSKNRLLEKLNEVNKKAYIDFGLFSSVTPKTNLHEVAKICTAFKIYLATTTGELLFSDNKLLSSTLANINELGSLTAIHAESEKIIRENLFLKPSVKNLHEYFRIRPNEAEVSTVSELLSLARHQNNIKVENLLFELKKPNNVPIPLQKEVSSKVVNEKIEGKNSSTRLKNNYFHICHISTSEAVGLLRNYKRGIEAIKDFKNQSVKQVTAEVTPHHLLLNENFPGGAFGKVNPPLRHPKDQRALWAALADGTIDILASDHAPHTYDEKSQSFELAPAGVPGVETLLPLMLSHVKHNRLSLGRLASAITSTPAELFHLPKGRFEVGNDGDLIAVDFFKEEPIKAKNLHSKCGWTPYEKMDAIFPIFTLVRGKIIIKDGNLEVGCGSGKYYGRNLIK